MMVGERGSGGAVAGAVSWWCAGVLDDVGDRRRVCCLSCGGFSDGGWVVWEGAGRKHGGLVRFYIRVVTWCLTPKKWAFSHGALVESLHFVLTIKEESDRLCRHSAIPNFLPQKVSSRKGCIEVVDPVMPIYSTLSHNHHQPNQKLSASHLSTLPDPHPLMEASRGRPGRQEGTPPADPPQPDEYATSWPRPPRRTPSPCCTAPRAPGVAP